MLLVLSISVIAVLLLTVIWGWIRWAKHKTPRTTFSTLSFSGFALATVSAVLALSSVVYAYGIGGFPFYDLRLPATYRWGALLSISAIVPGIGGAWRPNPLRWHAPLCAAGMLLFLGAGCGS